MEYTEFYDAVQTWCKSDKTAFSVIDSCESERKLTLINGNVSFFLIMPDEKSLNLNVWSDNDEVITHLGHVIDALSSCKKYSVVETLDFVNKAVTPMLGASNCNDVDDEGISDDASDDDDDVSDDDGMYYEGDDPDAMSEDITGVTAAADSQAEEKGAAEAAAAQYGGKGSIVAVQRLMKDMQCLDKAKGKIGVEGAPKGDDLFLWEVKLVDIPKDSKLGRDLQAYSKKYNREPCILMEMKFPPDYPFQPPFVRICRPRFKFLTGHVTIGGSICMQLLTKSGWSPSNDIESVLVQIRAEILSDSSAALDSTPDREYDADEARSAFQRMVVRYGWQ